MNQDHLPFDELAELAAGLLGDEAAEAARAHLADCAQCQEHAAAIAATSEMLAELPPVTMPPDVAGRLEQALAAEAASPGKPGATAAETVSGSRTVIPEVTDIRRHRRWSGPTMATSAVAAVVVLLVGALVIAHVSGGSSSNDTSGAGATAALAPSQSTAGPVGTNTTKDFTTASTGRVYTQANLTTLASGLVATSRPAAGDSEPQKDTAPSTADSTSSASSSVTSVAPSATRQPGTGAPTFSQSVESVSHARLSRCAAALATTPGAVPEAVDFARWTGGQFHHAPSIVIVFNGPRAGTLAVYVVGPTCNPNQLRTYAIVTPTG